VTYTSARRRADESHNPRALAGQLTIPELVAAFEEAERNVRRAFAMLVETSEKIDVAFPEGIRIDASQRGNEDDFANVERTIDRMKRDAWAHVVARFELRRFMSVKRWNEMQQTLEKGELPELTVENAAAFAEQWRAMAPEMLTEAVNEVFEILRPGQHSRTFKLKCNSQLEVPPKVALAGYVERQWSGTGYRVDYNRQQEILALERIFLALDGKGVVSKNYSSELDHAMRTSDRGETALFRFRCFKNRNLHLWFKRRDLLQRFNQIAGGKRLRPGTTDEGATA
jgi:hypothetical protein